MPAREVSTREIVVHAITHGKSVFVPYIYRSQHRGLQKPTDMMDMLALRSEEDLNSLRPDAWGIPTLDEDSVAGRENALSGRGIGNSATTDQQTPSQSEVRGLDLMLVPGVAFDTQNRRLGHGKGFYDRYLQRYKDIVSSGGNAPMPRLGKKKGPRFDGTSLILGPQLASLSRNKCSRWARLSHVAVTTGRWMK
jgi:5-formyltetrahydrofolate cyclo-ligase